MARQYKVTLEFSNESGSECRRWSTVAQGKVRKTAERHALARAWRKGVAGDLSFRKVVSTEPVRAECGCR